MRVTSELIMPPVVPSFAFGVVELRRFGGDQQVAHHHQHDAAADAPAGDSRDHRLVGLNPTPGMQRHSSGRS